MIYVLAAIGALTVSVLMWRAFGPVRDAASDGPASAPRRAPLAPDDDPEFLRRLAEQQRDRKNDEQG
ncbi:hypothetical protein [Saccharopolyspora gregorii]|uniref:Secreted protein n=1 Tax=Saccharopolyspora gregorii TaxID=33914 RepID=A0ABP6S0X3_9PSEU|nr:hypothetical protein [Saccharopolyspora gregorii]